MKKQHRGRHLAAGRRREPKELTWGDCGSRRKLAAAAERCPLVQQWHGARETSSGKFGPREIVDGRRNWPQPAGGSSRVQKWHDAGDTVFWDAVMRGRRSNRYDGRIRPGIDLQEEPGKDGRAGGDNWCARKAPMEPGTETSWSSYVWEAE
jgi:hypothetical protein